MGDSTFSCILASGNNELSMWSESTCRRQTACNDINASRQGAPLESVEPSQSPGLQSVACTHKSCGCRQNFHPDLHLKYLKDFRFGQCLNAAFVAELNLQTCESSFTHSVLLWLSSDSISRVGVSPYCLLLGNNAYAVQRTSVWFWANTGVLFYKLVHPLYSQSMPFNAACPERPFLI